MCDPPLPSCSSCFLLFLFFFFLSFLLLSLFSFLSFSFFSRSLALQSAGPVLGLVRRCVDAWAFPLFRVKVYRPAAASAPSFFFFFLFFFSSFLLPFRCRKKNSSSPRANSCGNAPDTGELRLRSESAILLFLPALLFLLFLFFFFLSFLLLFLVFSFPLSFFSRSLALQSAGPVLGLVRRFLSMIARG